MKVLLRIRDYAGTITWIKGRVNGVPERTGVSLESIRTAEYTLAKVAALYPGRARCLEQSLTLYYLLRRRGVPARYCQGVKPHPFQAHAWVEYGGTVINDVAEHARLFARLPDQLP